MDITTITDALTAAVVTVGTIGAGVLGVHVALKTFSFVRSALRAG